MEQVSFLTEAGDVDYSTLRFDGADYQPERDNVRLGTQLQRVKDVIKDGQWYTVKSISMITGDPETSVSAQVRNLRKKRFGKYIIDCKRLDNGLYQYRMA